MAPLAEALTVKFSAKKDDHVVYEGTVDGTWTVGNVPNGGYIVGLVIQACILESTAHKDPLHVTSHFLQPTSVAPFQVLIKQVKSSKSFTHFAAEFVQDNRTRTISQLIFSDLTVKSELLAPPSPYARRIPVSPHPAKAIVSKARSAYTFQPHAAKFALDKDILARNLPDSSARTNNSTIGGGGLEWGTWVTLQDPKDRITPASLAFLADISENMSSLLAKATTGSENNWYPTMVMALEFKSPIPRDSEGIRTIGVYSNGTFLNDPQGRHDMYTEVWTAPSNIGEGTEEDGWRDKQRCLITSTQMALTVPFARNTKQKGKL